VGRAPRTDRLRHWLTRALSAGLGLAAMGALVFVLDPGKVGHALADFPLGLIPVIVLLYVGVFVLQGVRWHYLLRDAGATLRLWDSVLLNAAGQTITALVPLGDLTRAALASQAGKRDFGTLAATVTVQELTYNLMLILCALPVLLTVRLGVAVIVATLLGMVAIVLMLTVSPVFHVIHRVIVHIPLLNRLVPAIDDLQEETVVLLHRPDALVLSLLDLARAGVAITVFWLVVVGLSPGRLDWTEAAFVLALSSIGGAISLLPGGVGANEASLAGLLLVFGVAGGAAGAAALIQRFLLSVMALVLGVGAYLIVRRRFPHLGSMFQLVARQQEARRESQESA
jgi:glycosyltransferase 2 family protein